MLLTAVFHLACVFKVEPHIHAGSRIGLRQRRDAGPQHRTFSGTVQLSGTTGLINFQIGDITALANGEFHINSRTRPACHLNDILLIPFQLYRADQTRDILGKLRSKAASITTRERGLTRAGW